MKSRSLGVVLCLAVAAPVAQAQGRGQGWSFSSSRTVGANTTGLGAEGGFPGNEFALRAQIGIALKL